MGFWAHVGVKGTVALAATALIAGLIVHLSALQQSERIAGSLNRPALTTPKPAPPFALRTFDGKRLELAEFRGKIVLLNFWASWCLPCRTEMPNLQRIWREYGSRGVVVLGIDVEDDPEEASAFAGRMHVTYPILHDPEVTRMNAYQVTVLPTTLFLDRALQIRTRVAGGYQGPQGYELLRQQVATLLQLQAR